jgi:hypothetical protein
MRSKIRVLSNMKEVRLALIFVESQLTLLIGHFVPSKAPWLTLFKEYLLSYDLVLDENPVVSSTPAPSSEPLGLGSRIEISQVGALSKM